MENSHMSILKKYIVQNTLKIWVCDLSNRQFKHFHVQRIHKTDILGIKTYDGLSLAADTFNLNSTDNEVLIEGFKKTNCFNYKANLLAWGLTLVLPCSLVLSYLY